MASEENNRRHFTRVPMDAAITLKCGKNEWTGILVDISLKGALIKIANAQPVASEQACRLSFTLDDNDYTIAMEGVVVHSDGEHVGVRCDSIDLESITYLKRLVELNLGDEALLERELSELTHTA